MPLIGTREKLAVNFQRRKPDALSVASIFLFQQKRPLLSKYLCCSEDPTGLKSSYLEG